MKLDTKAMATTVALLWGGAVLATTAVNAIKPGYGQRFLKIIEGIYPGYRARPSVKNAAVGTAYALLDGAIGGALVAGIYNRVLDRSKTRQSTWSRLFAA